MKIIEGMKDLKRIQEKIDDLKGKVQRYCADLDFENPTYPDQKAQVSGWIQSIHDSLKEALNLRMRIARTNASVIVPIELGGQKVEHSIAEWILRRRLFSEEEKKAWESLTNRNLKDGLAQTSAGERVTVKVRLYFDPVQRDQMVELYRSEPGIIDRTLEVTNAVTDLLP